MRIAVYGGSFNPPHVGHAMVAGWLRWADRADEVWLIPAFAHPFDKALRPFEARAAACRALAQAVGPWVRVSEIEASLPTPSYTIDTMDTIAAAHPMHSFRLVVGADVLPTVSAWKRWDAIVDRYAPIVVGRVGWPDIQDAPTFPGISSTEVRHRVAGGLPVDHLVPSRVLACWMGEL